MKNFILIRNPNNAKCLPLMEEGVDFLQKNGCTVLASDLTTDRLSQIGEDTLQRADAAVVFGGDGTFLRAAKQLYGHRIPLLGVNLGKLGYLADVETQSFLSELSAVVAGTFRIEERVALRATTENESEIGVNEVVIYRGGDSHIVQLCVDINGQRIIQLRADGLLVATPTGSTAYNLSAGGPIIVPTAENLVITPICAHSMAARPIVVGKNDVITVKIKDGTKGCAVLTLDGETVCPLNAESLVTIKISEEKVLLLRTKKDSFYQTLQRKLFGIQN